MQGKHTKVLLIHNYMTPYRFPLFYKISKNKKIDLMVYFMSRSAKNRRWKRLPKLGFNYKVLPKIEFNSFGKDFFTYIINYTFPFEFFKNMFDVVISAGWLDFASQIAFLLCKLTGKKFIIWSESTKNESSWRRSFTRSFVKFIVRNSDACIATGTLSKEYLISLGAKPEKIFIAYSTVDVDFFKKVSNISKTEKSNIRRSVGIETGKVILYVGQFIERKGIIFLIKAFKILKQKYKNISLVLLGYGPQEKKLYSFIKEKNIKNIIFLKHKEINEMPKIYSIADIFVLPSLEETWGLVVNEAMACGLPVVGTSKVGSTKDLIKDGVNGYIVKAGDSHELSLAIGKIIRSSAVANNFSKRSLQIIRSFTPSTAATVFVKAIKSCFM